MENGRALGGAWHCSIGISRRTSVSGSADQTGGSVARRSPPDIVARLLTDKMSEILGQPVIVENRGGAGGIIGAKSVIAADPDGYTLMLGSTSTLLIAPLIYKNAGYNAATFTPISRVADSSEVLAVHRSAPPNPSLELIALAKARPGALNFASAGNGTLPHIEGELLKAQAKIDVNLSPIVAAAKHWSPCWRDRSRSSSPH